MPKHAAQPADVLAWNAHGLRNGDPLANLLEKEAARLKQLHQSRLTAMVLTEVRYLHHALPKIATQHGLVVHQDEPLNPNGRPMPEVGSSALLVPEGWATWTIDDLEREWEVFSHDTKHKARQPVVGVGQPAGWDRDLKLIGCHGPTNGMMGGNRFAYAEYAARIELARNKTRPETVVAAIGDHNDKAPNLRRRFPDATIKGRNVDLAITWDLRRVESSAGPKYGSDHPLMRYRLHP